ncbi:nucleotidyltransferase family protein [Patescibacteria group bacterium]|nr:nucleotidyltransferase family protein [Patescibacteria group bacterium]MBU0777219.1 nucleotidyltransferase family protein [Patescibacteria group bacterium]MBU0845914.1 nucleotidyltransferase family protein [Patescibacteria group bacterium]MBU0922941.1 nucleotidyltransferase family protein [Patescibacteria group bacterium]MBU1066218.1 nucleotidyltransferase family protein [Patescibacteria group bacterium]
MKLDQGKSMSPLILPNDKIIVAKTSSLKVNDIVVFKKEKRLIAHRLIYISPSKDFLVTKGDNNLKSDGKIKPSQILGKVNFIKRNGETIKLSHIYLSQSSAYLQELIKINKALDQKHIPYIFLKGLPLHLHFGQTFPKRLYLDADILTNRTSSTQVDKVLVSFGFKKQKRTLFDKKNTESTQISYLKETKPFPVIIDLHLEPAIGFTKLKSINKLLPSTKQFAQYLFKNIQIIKLDKRSFPILNTETLILYLFLHLYHHNFHGAHRLEFIDAVIKNQKIDWDKVATTTQKFNFTNFVLPGVSILRHYYETPLPTTFLKTTTPFPAQRLAAKAITKFISPFNSGTRAQEGVKRAILLFLLSPSSPTMKAKILFHKEIRSYFLPTIKSLVFKAPTNSS